MTRPGRLRRPIAHVLIAAVAGVLLAAVAAHVFFVGAVAWWNLIVWAAVAVAVGLGSRTWPAAAGLTAVIGYTIVFSYSLMGYHAEAPVFQAIGPFAVLSVVGAAGMAIAGAVGHGLRLILRHRLHGAAAASERPR